MPNNEEMLKTVFNSIDVEKLLREYYLEQLMYRTDFGFMKLRFEDKRLMVINNEN